MNVWVLTLLAVMYALNETLTIEETSRTENSSEEG